jgi:geranylgeranyl diphosphate synthase type 3
MKPFDYVMALPGKILRTQVLSTFNIWLQIDEHSYNVFHKVVAMLHNASLLCVDLLFSWARAESF